MTLFRRRRKDTGAPAGASSSSSAKDLLEVLGGLAAGSSPDAPGGALILLDLYSAGAVDEATTSRVAEVLGGIGAPGACVQSVGAGRVGLASSCRSVEEALALAGRAQEEAGAHFGSDPAPVVPVAVLMLGDRREPRAILRDAEIGLAAGRASGQSVQVCGPQVEEWAVGRVLDAESLALEVDEVRSENRMLSEGMLVDPRTGLANAAAFDADIVQVHARKKRSGDNYAVIVIEIDLYHDFQESCGRPAARKALEAIAKCIQETVRLTDRAYRMGGEEFAVLLPGADGREAVAAGERIRQRVERLGITHPTADSGLVTVTLGVVEAGYRHSTHKDVVAEAQDLLLEGKSAGRNRVVWPH